MDVVPLRDEWERLDHRRARLREILELGWVSAEMQAQIRQSLAEIDERLAALRPGPNGGDLGPYRLPAMPSRKVA